MIKFIAADMDGPLLDSQKRLPPDFEYVLKELNKRGVIFAAASGRQYETLRREFEHINEKMMIIAENGALVFNGGENVLCEPLGYDKVCEILDRLKEYPTLYPIVCGVDSAYGEKRNDEVISDVIMYYNKYKTVDNLKEAAKADKILKIAVFDSVDAEKYCFPIMSSFDDELTVILSGDKWVDAMKKDISKGSAIRKIREMYGIKREECAAFGDYMNDYEMMRECGESYAMANAYPGLKKVCKYVCKSNDEHGVTEKIKEIFGI